MRFECKECGDSTRKNFVKSDTQLVFDSHSGDLLAYRCGQTWLHLGACYFDVGVEAPTPNLAVDLKTQGRYLRNSLAFYNFDCIDTEKMQRRLLTNELPYHYTYTPESKTNPAHVTFSNGENHVSVAYTIAAFGCHTITIETTYTCRNNCIEMASRVTNAGEDPLVINGAAYILADMQTDSRATFEIPGSTPCGVYTIAGLAANQQIQTDFSSPYVHYCSDTQHTNIIYVNPIEKWTTGIYKHGDGEGCISQLNLSCTIAEILPGQQVEIGTQYLQLLAPQADPYQAASDLYAAQGWMAPSGSRTATAIYTCHPAGTSDNDFCNPDGSNQTGTLEAMAEQLPALAEIGIDNIWIMPVFAHPADTGTLYLPYHMEHIDDRYSDTGSGDASMQRYIAAAKGLGIHVLFDYVPHGPCMYRPDMNMDGGLYDNPWLTPERLAWIGTDRHGKYSDEWKCYSLDYSNPGYLAYMKGLVKEQAKEFGITGARIDVCMGSLPNWTPFGGHRISQSGAYGGALMAKAIREGLLEAGQAPLVYPENSFPIPYYAPFTDLFYDFPFYRMTRDLRLQNVNEKTFAYTVAHWLEAEIRSAPKGMQFGRFLENSDTVSCWYPEAFDCARAVDVYGVEKARALWFLLATIDGSFVLYQGDEAGNEAFFTGLLSMRKKHLGPQYGIEYFPEKDSGVVAYRRYLDADQKLVLANLTSQPSTRNFAGRKVGNTDFASAEKIVLYGEESHFAICGGEVRLAPYSCVVLQLEA